ncbi:MAG: hypothetical protein HOV97_05915 [Nonomuraea sp.]|nr:hypothetical protein [Nonomuraea sp.]
MSDMTPEKDGLLPCCLGRGKCQAPPDIGPCPPMSSAEQAQVILARLLRDSHDDCELTGFSGSGRCIEPAVAARLDGGFVDLVCAEHAERARARGTQVVYPPEAGSDG